MRFIGIVTVIAVGLAGRNSAQQQDNGAGDYIHYRLGVKYAGEKNYDAAVDEFRRVLAAYPDNYNAYMQLAEIRLAQQQPRLAIYNLKQALTYNPGWGKAHRLLAGAYEEGEQYQNAIAELQLYQQTCEPSERDSVQARIRLLVAKVAGQGGVIDTSKSVRPAPGGGAVSRAVVSEGGDPAGDAPAVPPERTAGSAAAFESGVALYGEGKYGPALEQFRICLQQRPGHAGAYYYAGMIRRRMGQNGKAAYNFKRALSFPQLGYNAHFYLGRICGDEKDYPAAIRHFEAYLAASSFAQGRREAQGYIDRYRKLLGTKAPAGQRADSVKNAEPATEAPPTAVEVRIDKMLSMMIPDTFTERGRALLRGVTLFRAQRYDEAIGAFREAQVRYPTGETAAQCIYNTGLCYLRLRLFANAENQFQQLLDRFPTHALAANALFLKALTYLERKEPSPAERLFRDYLRRNRQHEWVGKGFEKLGDAYRELEQHKLAADSYEEAVKLAADPSDKVYACFKLGQEYFAIDNTPRGLEAFRQAIAAGEAAGVYERVPDSYFRIADCWYRGKEYTQALAQYTTAVRKYPGYQETPWGLFQIGNCNRSLRNYQQAVDAYNELLRKYPDDYWASQAKWKMEDTIWEHEYQAILR